MRNYEENNEQFYAKKFENLNEFFSVKDMNYQNGHKKKQKIQIALYLLKKLNL